MNKLVVATGNKGKLKEIISILGDKFEILSMKDVGFSAEIEENGSSFLENATIKAKALYYFCHIPTLADDSGLCVDALGGLPSIYSARFSGKNATDDENIDKLLKNMQNITNRKAKFVCNMVYFSQEKVAVGVGEVYGEILTSKRGQNGFGYDSVFFSPALNKTFAQATDEEKNEISHRKLALFDLLKKL